LITPRSLILTGSLLLIIGSGSSLAQQPKPSPEPPRFPTPPASARLWLSLTTNKIYRVWTENNRLFAEWVNIAPASARRGAYIHTECQRTGTRWIGTSHSYLPCEREGSNKNEYNWCPYVTKIEFDRVEANRITGRAEGLKRHDCNGCRVIETVWKNFEWIPKEQEPVPMKRP